MIIKNCFNLISGSLVFLLLISCNDNSVNPIDNLNYKKIVGTWYLNGDQISFDSERNYTSTTTYILYNSTSTYDTVIVTVKAKYSIENSIISYSNLNITYYESTDYQNTIFGEISTQNIDFVGDSLVLRGVSIYNKVEGLPGVIEGKWKTSRYGYYISSFINPPFNEGNIDVEIVFVPEDSVYRKTTTYQYLIPQTAIEDGKYIYKNNQIKLDLYGEWKTLIISNSKMFWYNNRTAVFRKN